MLRRTLLAVSKSQQIHRLITTTRRTRAIVDRYVAGVSNDDAVRVARELRAAGLLVSLDYLGEDTTDAAQATAVTEEYVHLIGKLGGLADGGAVEVSVKPTAVGLYLGERIARQNIERIAATARDAGTTVTIDAEDHQAVEAVTPMVDELREKFAGLGCVVQAALRRTEADCAKLAALPGTRVRLCKGAYREPESEAYTARHEIDRSYARCLRMLMNGKAYPMVASHDPRLIEIAGVLARQAERDNFEYQMLYGIRPDEQRRLAATGAAVRVYVPYGNDWYGYLVRRLAERPSNLAFFLRSLRSTS